MPVAPEATNHLAVTLIQDPSLSGSTALLHAITRCTQLLMGLPVAMLQISTGLDASTTYSIVRSMRNFVYHRDATVLMALLQPPPEVRHDLGSGLMVNQNI